MAINKKHLQVVLHLVYQNVAPRFELELKIMSWKKCKEVWFMVKYFGCFDSKYSLYLVYIKKPISETWHALYMFIG